MPDREGRNSQVPLLGLAIGVVPSSLIHSGDTQELAALTAKAKKLAKDQPGSSWYCLTIPDCKSPALDSNLNLVSNG